MKTLYVSDLQKLPLDGSEVALPCWVADKRRVGTVVFLELADSTGRIQSVVHRSNAALFDFCRHARPESSVEAFGVLATGERGRELHLTRVSLVGGVEFDISPRPRASFNIFDEHLTDHLLRNRHLYLRNEKVMAMMQLRHHVLGFAHDFFRGQGFIDFAAPILTPLPLYEDGSAMSINVNDEKVFLTQCVGFYLEAAAHGLERVYNIGPSFRGEESRSLRHLMEYWHVKAEFAWGNRDDAIDFVERLLASVFKGVQQSCGTIFETLGRRLNTEGQDIPYPRITYCEALERLKLLGVDVEFGTSLSSRDELLLSKQFRQPFWVVGLPRAVEPFPYCIDPDDTRRTLTADLIASRGYGELLGVAQKIHRPAELRERLAEKGKLEDSRYGWVKDSRAIEAVPRAALGMGLERLIRWIADVPHVRDAVAFPRTFRRHVYP